MSKTTYRNPLPCKRHGICGCVACDEQVPSRFTECDALRAEIKRLREALKKERKNA
jgi:hypothetical protein